MKKTILLFAVLLTSLSINAQEIPKLQLTKAGIESIVVSAEGIPSSELYTNALNWIQETYKNPDKVLKLKIENEKIRVSGYASDSWNIKSLGMKTYYDYSYLIEVYFKDGKYKFDYTITELSDDGKKFFYNCSAFYKKDGSVRKMYVGGVEDINNQMNSLSKSFYDYVTGKTKEKNSDW